MAAEPVPSRAGSAGDDRLRVVYLLGSGRSGSTLLERTLDQSPRVASLGELFMLWRHGVLGDRLCSCGTPIRACPFWSQVEDRVPDLFTLHLAREMEAAHRRILRTARLHRLFTPTGRAAIRRELPEGYLDRIARLYRAIQSVAGVDTLVDSSKHPVTGWLVGGIDGIDVRYLHLVRDARATAFSWSRVRDEPGAVGTQMNRYPPLSAAVQWDIWNLASMAVCRRGGRSSRLRYEDLMTRPREEIDDLLRDLGLPLLDPDVLDDHQVRLEPGHAVSGNPMRFSTGSVPITPDHQWIRSMARRDRRVVTVATAPLLHRLGYSLRPGDAGPAPLTRDAEPDPAPPGVVLISHTTQYRHAARALHRDGRLVRYVTLPVRGRPLSRRGWRRLGADHLNRRAFVELEGIPLARMWFGAAIAAGARAAATRAWFPRPFWIEGRAWDLDARVRGGHGDIVHAVDGIAVSTLRRARRRGATTITDLRAAHPSALALAGIEAPDRRWTALRRRQQDLSDILICNSDYTRQTYVDAGYDPSTLVVVPLGADLDLFHPAEGPPDRFTVLFVGRFEPAKGSVELAAACRRLPRHCRVVVIGRAPPQHRTSMEGVAAEVQWIPHLPHHQLADAYRSASVLVLPSRSDGWGMVVIEAMASGLPVIVSDHTGSAMAVTEGVDGHVIPRGDVDGLADLLCDLEGDPAKVRRMGRAARQTAAGYSWEDYGARLIHLYRGLDGSA